MTSLDFEYALAGRDDQLAEAMHGEHEPQPAHDADRFLDPGFATDWDKPYPPTGPTWEVPF